MLPDLKEALPETDGADGAIYINTGSSNVLFDTNDHKTNTNGRLEFNFWDEGESGNVNINLSYSDEIRPDCMGRASHNSGAPADSKY